MWSFTAQEASLASKPSQGGSAVVLFCNVAFMVAVTGSLLGETYTYATVAVVHLVQLDLVHWAQPWQALQRLWHAAEGLGHCSVHSRGCNQRLPGPIMHRHTATCGMLLHGVSPMHAGVRVAE
jgi:hypothetical protein